MKLTFSVVCVALLALSALAEVRMWKDKTGRFSIRAELVESDGTTARLKNADGSVIKVPVDRLSDADRQFLASQEKTDKLTVTAQAAEFRPDGIITSGGWTLAMQPRGQVMMSDAAGDFYHVHLSLKYAANHQWFSAAALGGRKITVDADKKSTLLRGTIQPPDGAKPVDLEWGMELTPHGNPRFILHFLTQSPIEQVLSLANIHVHSPRAAVAGKNIQADGTCIAINTDRPGGNNCRRLWEGKPARITYLSDQPARRLVFIPVTVHKVALNDCNGQNMAPYIELQFVPENNRVVFDLSLPKTAATSAETYGGVDFYAADKLCLPRYHLCRNLIQNGSFEQGQRYWLFAQLGRLTDCRRDEYYQVVHGPPWRGRCCLKLLGKNGQCPAPIATFAIPVDACSEYTISFYAKADKAGRLLNLYSISAVWPVFPAGRSFRLTTQWRRYALTFKAPNGAISLGFNIANPPQDCWAMLDGVQLEKGAMTAYTEKPAGVTLLSSGRGNLVDLGQNRDARLAITGPANATGQIALSVTDFSGRIIHKSQRSFTLAAYGLATLPLPWAEALPQGIYIIQTDLRLSDGFTDRDFHRLTVLPFLNNTFQHKNIFAVGATNSAEGDWARRFAFWKHVGIGASIHFDPQPHAYLKGLAENNILNVTSIFDDGNGFKSLSIDLSKDFHLSDEQLKAIEEAAYAKAGAYHEIHYWKLVNEPPSTYIDNLAEMKLFIKALAAARRGLLRANPHAVILSPDPERMHRDLGTRYLDTFLSAGGKSVCDLMAVHTYRARPEEPDLDADTALFLDMLQRHGYHGDVWFTEGIYHQNNMQPVFGLNVYEAGSSNDHYRAGPFSYDMGWAERVCCAYTTRSWLVALKYANRVKVFVDWGFAHNCYLDTDMTPCAAVLAANTLGHVLGNATFRRDIDFGEDVRCYLFEDQQQRPVAAIWCHKLDVDQGRAQGPVLDLSALPADIQAIDLMGKDLNVSSRKLALSPFPIFLRGAAGSLAAMAVDLEKGWKQGRNFQLRFRGDFGGPAPRLAHPTKGPSMSVSELSRIP